VLSALGEPATYASGLRSYTPEGDRRRFLSFPLVSPFLLSLSASPTFCLRSHYFLFIDLLLEPVYLSCTLGVIP